MKCDAVAPSRREFLTGAMALMAATATGCTIGLPPRLLIGLIDLSDSVSREDWAGYQATLANMVGSLRASQLEAEADMLIIAPIDGRPLTQLLPIYTEVITDIGTSGGTERIAAKKEKICSNLADLGPSQFSKKTRIFDAIAAAGELIAANPSRTPEVVVMCDMLEDSPYANFAANPPADAAIEPMIERLRSVGLIPNLAEAAVHVTGGGGADASVYDRVRAFWKAYFPATNAKLGNYTRAPLQFAAAG